MAWRSELMSSLPLELTSLLLWDVSLENTEVKFSLSLSLSLSLSISPLFFPMTPSPLIAPCRPRFNEAISFAGAPIQNKCVVLINTGCLICNSAAKPCLLYLHHAWGCHRDLAVPPVSGIHPRKRPNQPAHFRDFIPGRCWDIAVRRLSRPLTQLQRLGSEG